MCHKNNSIKTQNIGFPGNTGFTGNTGFPGNIGFPI